MQVFSIVCFGPCYNRSDMADNTDENQPKRKLVPRSFTIFEDQAEWIGEEAWQNRLRDSAYLRQVLDEYKQLKGEAPTQEAPQEEEEMVEPVEQKVVSVNEAARQKNVHPQTIRDAISRGSLKGYKSGKFYMVDAESLATYAPIERGPYHRRPKKD
jgi:excisionase family DNA binding protein